jgi:hypothetical protein
MKEILFIAILASVSAPIVLDRQTPDAEVKKEESPFKITRYLLIPENVKDKAIAIIKFESQGKWKWNKNYSPSFKLKDSPGRKILETHIEQDEGPRVDAYLHIKYSKKLQPLTVVVKWGMCTETSCRVYKKEIKF